MKLTKNIWAMLVASSLLVSTHAFSQENSDDTSAIAEALNSPELNVPDDEKDQPKTITKGQWADLGKTIAELGIMIFHEADSDIPNKNGGIIYNLKHLSNWAADAQKAIEELERRMPEKFDLSRLTAVETKLAALQQREPSDYAAAIARNAASISQLNQRVAKVEKNLKQGLATQAALAGLFQPYNVGKVNVTAAVGGHRSEAAVAVGAGYRLNERFAAKTGVAVNSSGLSYNVGVNFEF